MSCMNFKFCKTIMQEINLCVHETFCNDNRQSLKLLEQTTHQPIVNMWPMAFVEIAIIVLSKRSLCISYVYHDQLPTFTSGFILEIP